MLAAGYGIWLVGKRGVCSYGLERIQAIGLCWDRYFAPGILTPRSFLAVNRNTGLVLVVSRGFEAVGLLGSSQKRL